MTNLPAEIPADTLPRVRERNALAALFEALDSLAHQAAQLAEAGDVAALGAGLGRLREFRRAVSDLERDVEDHTAGLMDRDVVEADGLMLERRQSKVRRAWQSEELLRHLVGDQLVNPETGENVYRTLVECVPFTGSLGWRTGALKARGVAPDDWCDETEGRATVRVQATETDQ